MLGLSQVSQQRGQPSQLDFFRVLLHASGRGLPVGQRIKLFFLQLGLRILLAFQPPADTVAQARTPAFPEQHNIALLRQRRARRMEHRLARPADTVAQARTPAFPEQHNIALLRQRRARRMEHRLARPATGAE